MASLHHYGAGGESNIHTLTHLAGPEHFSSCQAMPFCCMQIHLNDGVKRLRYEGCDETLQLKSGTAVASLGPLLDNTNINSSGICTMLCNEYLELAYDDCLTDSCCVRPRQATAEQPEVGNEGWKAVSIWICRPAQSIDQAGCKCTRPATIASGPAAFQGEHETRRRYCFYLLPGLQNYDFS